MFHFSSPPFQSYNYKQLLKVKYHFSLFILILLGLGFNMNLKAQTSLISSAGALLKNGSYQLEGSIGETVSGSLQNIIILTQGFHQPRYLIVSVANREFISFKIYPNPTSMNFFIQVEDMSNLSFVQLQIIDMKGSVAKMEKVSLLNYDNRVDISSLTAGVYVIQILDINGQLKGQHKLIITQ